MIMENGKITLPRFQMFAWTWIGVIAYLGLLFYHIISILYNQHSFENLTVPSLPYLFIALMGLSQITYLTAKSVRPSIVSINEIRPQNISIQQKDNFVTILGSNFGNIGTIWIESYPPVTDAEKNRFCPKLSIKEKERIKKKGLDINTYEKEFMDDWTDEYRYSKFRLDKQQQFNNYLSWNDNGKILE